MRRTAILLITALTGLTGCVETRSPDWRRAPRARR